MYKFIIAKKFTKKKCRWDRIDHHGPLKIAKSCQLARSNKYANFLVFLPMKVHSEISPPQLVTALLLIGSGPLGQCKGLASIFQASRHRGLFFELPPPHLECFFLAALFGAPFRKSVPRQVAPGSSSKQLWMLRPQPEAELLNYPGTATLQGGGVGWVEK